MPLVLREATAADARAIAKLHAESWRLHYRGAYSDDYLDHAVFEERDAAWRERFSTPAENQFVVVAEDDGELVGFACAFGGDDERWGTLLDNIHVRAERQGTGVGARLVAEVVAWCRARYPDRGLYLWVLGQNVRAQGFYGRLGARDVGSELKVPSVGGGEARPVHRYAWDAPVELTP
jgi:GNAT superfamily N-acetyltransferase